MLGSTGYPETNILDALRLVHERVFEYTRKSKRILIMLTGADPTSETLFQTLDEAKKLRDTDVRTVIVGLCLSAFAL